VPDSVRVTTLCENTAGGPNLLGEHGLAMLLEARGKKILFDTGAGRTLLPNVQSLGVNLQDLDAVVLSHGHYDHTGGLPPLLKKHPSLLVYAHPDIFGAKYRRKNGVYKYIGVPWSRQQMEQEGARFCLNRLPVELGPGIMLTGGIPRREEKVPGSGNFFLKTEAGMVADSLEDDQALVLESSAGLVVLLGCAHAGLVNTLQYIRKLTGQEKIYALLGGTHLLDLKEEELRQILEQLQDFGLQKIAPCHCTGLPAQMALARVFRENFLVNRAGSTFEL